MLVGANASGDHPIVPLFISKPKNPKCFKRINLEEESYLYDHQQSKWMTSVIFTRWFNESFVPDVTVYLRSKRLPLRALLILDNFKGHPRDMVDLAGVVTVIFMPPNCTPLIQPMDQQVIANTKSRYRKKMNRALSQRDLDGKALPILTCMKVIDIKFACRAATESWNENSQPALMKAWQPLLSDISDLDRSNFILGGTMIADIEIANEKRAIRNRSKATTGTKVTKTASIVPKKRKRTDSDSESVDESEYNSESDSNYEGCDELLSDDDINDDVSEDDNLASFISSYNVQVRENGKRASVAPVRFG